MLLEDVIKVLQQQLPFYTDKFCDSSAINNISLADNVVTLNLDPTQGYTQKLKENNIVFVKNVGMKNPITNVTTEQLSTNSYKVIVTTLEDHDLVCAKNFQSANNGFFNVEIEGLAPAIYNGIFPLIPGSVPNRKTFTYIVNTALDIDSFDGAMQILSVQTHNFFIGYQSVVSNNEFILTYELPSETGEAFGYIPFVTNNSKLLFNIRVGGAAMIDEFFLEWYSAQYQNKWWLCAVLGDTNASKDVNIKNDATSIPTAGNLPNQRLITDIVLYVTVPLPQDSGIYSVSGRQAIDDLQKLMPSLLKCMAGRVFPSQLFQIPWAQTCFTDMGVQMYNKAALVYRYGFQITVDTVFRDMVDNAYPTRAFRDIYGDYLLPTEPDNDIVATLHVDLDEVPLP